MRRFGRGLAHCLITVLLVAPPASAQTPPRVQRAASELLLRSRHARIERGVGLGLAAIGLATIAVGGILVGVSGRASYDQGSRYQETGTILILSGLPVALAGGGIALDGQNRLNEVSWRLKLLSALFVAPAGGGLLAGISLPFF